MTNNILYYFGNDQVFYGGLKNIINEYSHGSVTLKKFFASQESAIQSLFSEVVTGLPDAVLVDFSLHPEDYLHLARILARTPFSKKIQIIGVLDHLKTSQVLIEAQSTGVSVCFIKSDHIKDIGDTLMRLVYPGKVPLPNYVKVRVNERWNSGIVSKVGYLHETGLHLETNLKLGVGETIHLNHFWCNKALIPSKEVTVKKVEEENLVYNFSYAVDVDFEFIDQIKTPDRTPEEEVKRYNLIEDAKYRFKKTFLRSLPASLAKRAKVLILDSEFLIYQESKRSDRFPFMLRCLGSDVNLETELKKLCPHIIVFSLSESIDEKVVAATVAWAQQQKLPRYFVIFNSPLTVSEWQSKLGFKNIVASSETMNTEILLKIAQIFDTKIQAIEKDNAKKLFISKHKEESNCEIQIAIKVEMLSETSITFLSKRRIPVGSNLNICAPIRTLAYIYKEQEDGGLYRYSAILHSHDELEKNSIRRFINEVLFRENEIQVTDRKGLVTQEIKLKEILKNSHLKDDD